MALNVRVTPEIHAIAQLVADHRQASVSTMVAQLVMEEARRLGLSERTATVKPSASE